MAFTVRGAEVHLRDEGVGTPTLFLHGNPDSADLWDGVITRLRPHHHCLAPEHERRRPQWREPAHKFSGSLPTKCRDG
jgi:hypothetical protein